MKTQHQDSGSNGKVYSDKKYFVYLFMKTSLMQVLFAVNSKKSSTFESHIATLNLVPSSLDRSSDLSNSGEFKTQTASEIAIQIHSFLRDCSDTQSVSSWFYKGTELKI